LAGAAASIGVVVDVPKFDPPPVVDPTVPPVVPPVVSPSETSDIPPVVTKTTTAVAKVVAAAKTVIVKTGDTLTKIAKANGTTVTAILAANPKFTDNDKYKGGNLIFSGTTVKIPGAPVVSPTPIVNSAASLGTNDAANWARTMTAAATPAAAPVVNVVINKNIEDSAVQGIMTRAIKDAMEAR
jgi:LysM repeat protein